MGETEKSEWTFNGNRVCLSKIYLEERAFWRKIFGCHSREKASGVKQTIRILILAVEFYGALASPTERHSVWLLGSKKKMKKLKLSKSSQKSRGKTFKFKVLLRQ